ncbi:hypothetical protein K0M31_007312 [Melipona bicolor]|uniref:Uncharacterized protein n=1 Tax=Melipona bicolor TaxID=60889 RepID=A0AA40GBE8_9HYME|nr:hypothetical protein K0M31_007312 [Melipona bicolor]
MIRETAYRSNQRNKMRKGARLAGKVYVTFEHPSLRKVGSSTTLPSEHVFAGTRRCDRIESSLERGPSLDGDLHIRIYVAKESL